LKFFKIVLRKLLKKIFKVHLPDGAFRVCIDLIGLCLIVYEILEIPLLLSFPEIDDDTISMISNFINFCFIGDIIVNFNTAFYKRGTIVKKRKEIFKNYFSSWFVLGLFLFF